ncbi:YihA family ribosome biogenesis GTP-binding protein [Candidatus Sumerlaeota bacterium]|nr:YihA family ribosome biogenesis GTP-binding protein [Candidatus Sumerlaeota bacterium]
MNLKDAKFLRAITRIEDAPRPAKPCILFAGRSNVGKSSLLNTLVQQKGLARTSSTPGRTQEIVYFDVAGKCYFVDLPGYGYAKVPQKLRAQWGPMIEKFIERNDQIRLVIIILDARRDPGEEEKQLSEWLGSLEKPHRFVVTKCDKLGKNELARRLTEISAALGLAESRAPIAFSSQTGAGRNELVRAILGAVA